jgi:hypothetical protein
LVYIKRENGGNLAVENWEVIHTFHRLIHKQIGKQTPASLEFAGVCEKSGKKSRFVVIIL